MLLPIPVLDGHFPSSSGQCGVVFSPARVPDLDCASPVSDRWTMVLTWLALAALAGAVGLCARRDGTGPVGLRVAIAVAGLMIFLMCWPVQAPGPSHCGSPLLTSYAALHRHVGTSGGESACAIVRGDRTTEALLVGAIALPALSLLRSRRESGAVAQAPRSTTAATGPPPDGP